MVEIVSRWDKTKVLYRAENATDVRTAVVEAVKARQRLDSAYLSGADLSGADLRSADLSGADLRSADLSGADLRSADLSGADLRSADLSGAYLRSADLRSAYLSGADLSGADLRSADLSGAYLRSADLSGAYLRSADLSGAYLRSADLRSADLSGAYLSGIRQDFWEILDAAPAEVNELEQALIDGEVDGATYSGACACLVGTIANVRGVSYDELPGITPDSDRPAEAWFLKIARGDKADEAALEPHIPPQDGWVSKETWDRLVAEAGEPKFSEGVFRAAMAVKWIGEWRESRASLVVALSAAGLGQPS